MQKAAIGILALLVLYFAAANARQAVRERLLEGRLAALETRRPATRKAAAEPVAEQVPVASVAEVPTPVPVAALTPAAVAEAPRFELGRVVPLDRAQVYFSNTFNYVKDLAGTLKTHWTAFSYQVSDADLELSETQRKLIDDLRKSRDLQTQSYREQIQKIEEQTEGSIRQLLNPDQLKKYDGQNLVQIDLPANVQPQESAAPQGSRAGYLGVTGADTKGDGVAITQVMDNSAAKAMGLQVGDSILDFNGQPVADYADLARRIREAGEGLIVTLKVRRNGVEMVVPGQLGGHQR